MRVRSLAPALVLIAAATASFAAPATLEGAKQISDGYAAYFGRAAVDKGVVTVAPDGDGYLVTWSLQTALDLAGASKDELRIGPFSYVLTPGDGDSWTAKADAFPSLAFNVPAENGQTIGAVDFGGFSLEMVYDARQPDFLRSLVAVDLVLAKFHGAEGGGQFEVDVALSGLSAETRAKVSDNGAGVDVAIAESAKGLSEAIVAPPDARGAPIKINYDVGATTSGATLSALRAREIGDFWRLVVAHANDAEAPPDLKQRLYATLPLWSDLKVNAEAQDMTLQAPMGQASLKTLGETIALSGLAADAAAEFGINIDQLALTSPLLPPWAASLSPASLSFDVRVADKGLDQVARLALDDFDFVNHGKLSPEAQNKIGAILLAGRPKLTLTPGRLTTPTLDLAFEGEVTGDASGPTGRFTITADSLDKTIALLAEIAESAPDMKSATLGATFLKGLATTGPDGRLAWKVEASEAGGLVVNGTQLAPGK